MTTAHTGNYRPGRSAPISYLVLHYTAGRNDSAAGNLRYFAQNVVKASAHYFVDDDSITRSVPDDYVAYHCGAYQYKHPSCRNANSIGSEMCDAKRDGKVMATEKTIQNAAELVYQLCKQYKIPYDHIIRHYDVTGKLCPAYWVKGDGLAKFRRQVEEVGEVVEKSYMIVDGKKVEVSRILKNGTNYVKIRDVAAALGLEVGFQGNIATLNRKK